MSVNGYINISEYLDPNWKPSENRETPPGYYTYAVKDGLKERPD